MSEPTEFDNIESDGTDEVIDVDQAFGDDAVDDVMGTSYSPPEKPRGMTSFGTTPEEALEGETLDQRLAEEEPDVQDQPAEAQDPRAGRLLAPDQGSGEDTEKDMVAQDVGIDEGAAGAEEAAVHVVDEDEAGGEVLAEDEGSSI